ncbi:MAG: methyltransferase [Saprospiraceae bacterium]|nr:methyltransferase [Saprospiraceae bacterium]
MPQASKNYLFRFKQFQLRHTASAMKVGTDSLLLGAWAPVTGEEKKLLDIGSGSGILCLMLAQKQPDARITGVEIDELAALESMENIAISPWRDRIHIFCQDICDFNASEKFDFIISNPPFYLHLQPGDIQRSLARHQSALNTGSLFLNINRLLSASGRCCMILPFDQETKYLGAARTVQLFPESIVQVRHRVHAPVRRLLITFGRTEVKVNSRLLTIEEDGNRSPEYNDMMKPYLL